MADQKFSELTEKTTAADTDELPLVNHATVPATGRRITFANLAASVLAKVASLTGKTTPVDADGVLLTDSAASNAAKFLTWANLKTAVFGALNGLTGKSTPASGDVFLLGDSAASYAGKKITFSEFVTAVNSSLFSTATWRAHTYAGYGGTDNKIPYFSTVVENVDTSSTYTIVNNSTNGLKITINKAGRYAIKFAFNGAAAMTMGLSVNSSQLTTSVGSITAADRIGIATPANTAWSGEVSITKTFNVNDVIRPHTDGTAAGTAALALFCIERVG